MEQEKENTRQSNSGDEIDLLDILRVLLKRKGQIVVITLIVTIAAGVLSMMLPKVYEVSAIIEPAKGIDEKPVEQPEAIQANILGGTYDQQLQQKFSFIANELPQWKVSIPKETTLVKISVETQNPKQSVDLMDGLLNLISAQIERKLEKDKKWLEEDVKLAELNHQLALEQLALLSSQVKETSGAIDDLEASKKSAMASRSSDAMAVLLYSNEIKNQQIYRDTLQLKLTNAKDNAEKAMVGVNKARLKIAQVKSTNINKKPTIPEKPIKPKKALIVALTFILGLMGSVIIAFVLELMSKLKTTPAQTDAGS